MIDVLKTNMDDGQQLIDLTNELDLYFEEADWNFDLEDHDKIFRINCVSYTADEIIYKLNELGIPFSELE